LLIDKDAVDLYTKSAIVHDKHEYPSEHMVRLIKWCFKNNGGRVLDYGFRFGENLKHLLDKGFVVDGVEISEHAIDDCYHKIRGIHNHRQICKLHLLTSDMQELPFDDDTFDYLISNQTLYHYSYREETIHNLLSEFKRVLKPGAKFIVSLISRDCNMSEKHKSLGVHSVMWYYNEGEPQPVYVIEDETHLRNLFNSFDVEEIGYWKSNYMNVFDFHYVVIGSNKVREVGR